MKAFTFYISHLTQIKLTQRYHRLNNPIGGIKPALKFIFDILKNNTMCNVCSRVDQPGFHAFSYMLKISSGCIPAAHERGFSFMKFRVTETDFSFLQSDQNIAATVCKILERCIDRPQ